LLPDIFASSEQFDEEFNIQEIEDDREVKAKMIMQLQKMLSPFMLRRIKSEVEKELPAKIETILFVGMSALQKSLYKAVLQRNVASITANTSSSGYTGNKAIHNILMELRKVCCHPYLVKTHTHTHIHIYTYAHHHIYLYT